MRCIVFGCKSNYTKVQKQILINVSFFRTPQNEQLKNKWLEVLKNRNIFIGKQKKICSVHFQPYDSFVATSGINKGRRLLNRDAVPSLNLPKSDVSDLEYQKFNKALFPSKKLVEYHRSKPLLKQKKKSCNNCEKRKKTARATLKTKDPNIAVVTIKEESNVDLEKESIKEESDVSRTHEISILDGNNANTTNNDAYSSSSIHIEHPKEKQFQICDTTSLSSCKTARATLKTKDPNIAVVTIKEESNVDLEKESIKEESDVPRTHEVSILDGNNANTTNNDAYSSSSIHIEHPKEKQFQICDTTNLSSCVCSNRIIQVENRQDLVEKKLDELLDLVRDISRRIRT